MRTANPCTHQESHVVRGAEAECGCPNERLDLFCGPVNSCICHVEVYPATRGVGWLHPCTHPWLSGRRGRFTYFLLLGTGRVEQYRFQLSSSFPPLLHCKFETLGRNLRRGGQEVQISIVQQLSVSPALPVQNIRQKLAIGRLSSADLNCQAAFRPCCIARSKHQAETCDGAG